jgi:hypothetical protein
MQCREFEERMHAVLDERGAPQADPRLAAHAAGCEHCRSLLRGLAVVLAGLSRLAAPDPGREFSRRVVAAAAGPQVSVQGQVYWRARLAAAACLAAAATVLLGLGIIWQARQHRGTWAERGERSGQSISRPRSRAGQIAFAQPGQARDAAATRSGELTGGQWLIEAPRLPQHWRNYRGAIGELAVAFPQAVEQFEHVDQMAPGFRSLRVSLGVIWDTLCRTIPGSRSEAAPDELQRPRTSLSRLDAGRVA